MSDTSKQDGSAYIVRREDGEDLKTLAVELHRVLTGSNPEEGVIIIVTNDDGCFLQYENVKPFTMNGVSRALDALSEGMGREIFNAYSDEFGELSDANAIPPELYARLGGPKVPEAQGV